MRTILFKKTTLIISAFLLIGIILRFLYFPDNVYFAYDQARDSFTALEILKGDFKLIGPPSFLSNKIFPGPLIFYIYALIYLIFDNNPEAISAMFRIFNVTGVILTFLLGTIIFNKKTGLIAALLFAISYEQTQYSLFISHQPLAVVPVLLFYLGLSLYAFKKNTKGLILTALGWGFAIQFHYGYLLLLFPLFFILFLFKNNIRAVQPKIFFLTFMALFLTLSTFVVAEVKYHSFTSYFLQNQTTSFAIYPKETLQIANRFIYDFFISDYQLTPIIGLLGIAIFLYFIFFQKKIRMKLLFLACWLMGSLLPYFLSGVPSYYYAAAASVSIIILFSYLIPFNRKRIILTIILLSVVAVNNLNQIIKINKTGINRDIAIQPGMLTFDQKKSIDYMYIEAQGKLFAVNILGIPLNVATTWSYLFEWYGNSKYKFLPVMGGSIADGYPGNLKIIRQRSQLPPLQFLIIEPTLGIREEYVNGFIKNEDYFSKIKEVREYGTIVVQKRNKI
ncbi:hypothetical protein A2617_04020 [Candidatus Daviesbacteria bacterium RIFOXYD1_FULL_41_10]|uniref:Glycosyltransferase RgtA/B/C/D-like domain-containing protein n=1 Tax=Candidatus Daviesbacteria bacterium RIFOXYD1_FULL_41_10 TaxID=1797801 RepID=A0A1F5N0E0_9BACT|nr:MAG: hypothetical protein A2617_04020 [Candidatus Daviesbacteria bacterium RIFOXYD1_FULL_41_10]